MSKVPNLRFKEFSEEWNNKLLSSFATKITQKNTDYKVTNVISNSAKNGLVSQKDYFDKDIANQDNINGYYVINNGDFVYNPRKSNESPYGPINRFSSTEAGVVSPLYLCFSVNHEVNDRYLEYYFKSSKWYQFIYRNSDQGARHDRVSIRDVEFFKMKLNVPNYQEQEKIASFFSLIDKKIKLQTEKVEELKNYKKGIMQKMFPRNGETVPELRFAGFTNAWEQRKLGDIIVKLTGGTSIAPDDYQEEGVRTIPKGAVNSTGVADLSGSKNVTEQFFERNISSIVSTNNLVTSLRDLVPSAPNMGRIVRIVGEKEDFLMPQGVYKIQLNELTDENFVIAFSNSDRYRKIITSEKNGSTQVHIRNGEFLNIDISTPSFEEQSKIGEYFYNLDNLITLHQCKLDALNEYKKGLLQQMFI